MHYLDSQSKTLKGRLIGFKAMGAEHTGKKIAEAIHDILIDLEIPPTKVIGLPIQILGITTDSASNNETCMAELESITKGSWQKVQWVRCIAHVVNIAVQDFLKELKASVKDWRVYIKSTVNCKLDLSLGEQSAFLKVIYYF